MKLEIGPNTTLSIEDVHQIGLPETTVELTDEARTQIRQSNSKVTEWVEEGRVLYGITTGVGELIHHLIPPEDSATMSENICHSHAVGVGDNMPPEMVRRAMGVRLHTFAQGYSGVQLELVELLKMLINRNITPIVPEQGTVSASGDLNPLAHMGVVLTGKGKVFYDGEIVSTREAFDQEGLSPVSLEPKEGLSCMNGVTVTSPTAAIALREMRYVIQTSLLATAFTLEVLHASQEPFDEDALDLRSHPGMSRVGEILRKLLEGSELIRTKDVIQIEFDKKLDEQEAVHTEDFRQESYALRGIPHIIGPSVETYHHCKATVERDLNGVDDNPLVFADLDECIHSAHFHAQPLAQAMDHLTISAAEVGVLSERQTARLLDPNLNKELPAFLAPDALSCGYEGAQYVAGSLVAENRLLAAPVSIQSLSLNAQFQDVVSMGFIAARQAREVLEHVGNIINCQLMAAAQAADFRGPEKLSPISRTLYDHVREVVPELTEDRPLTADFAALEPMITDGGLVRTVKKEYGDDLLSLSLPDT